MRKKRWVRKKTQVKHWSLLLIKYSGITLTSLALLLAKLYIYLFIANFTTSKSNLLYFSCNSKNFELMHSKISHISIFCLAANASYSSYFFSTNTFSLDPQILQLTSLKKSIVFFPSTSSNQTQSKKEICMKDLLARKKVLPNNIAIIHQFTHFLHSFSSYKIFINTI